MADIEDIIPRKVSNLLVKDVNRHYTEEQMNDFITEIVNESNNDNVDWSILFRDMKRKHSMGPSTVSMNYHYYKLLSENKINRSLLFEQKVIGKTCRSNSGITQVTVLSSPYPNGQKFSCEYDCYYCPKEPAHEGNNFVEQPRSYLYNEPAVRRANANNFDAAKQMWDRMSSLFLCGLKVDKLEVMVLGGTWGSYPEDYRDEFIRDLYYSANTFYQDMDKKRIRYSLQEEIELNQISLVRIIGLTLETRPDYITAREIQLFRKYNCTRVQIGVQHIDKRILSKINRGCYVEDTKRAIRNLLNVGLKVDIHLMFDLPYATMDDDIKMINTIYSDNDLRFDQVKFYPFASLDWTKTKEWEDKGHQLHYTQDELISVLLHAKQHIAPWVRINRVIRDIPSDYILDGNDIPNLRQHLLREMDNRGIKCKCIRCREVKNKTEAIQLFDSAILVKRKYEASGGIEYFLSIESPNHEYIYGFCRLRLSKDMGMVNDIEPTIHRKRTDVEKQVNLFENLNDSGMIRELHVYGMMDPVNRHNNIIQHKGIGKRLVKEAENIAWCHGYKKISIISGVGVREYYKKLGYSLENTYMVKYFPNISGIVLLGLILFIISIVMLIIFLST